MSQQQQQTSQENISSKLSNISDIFKRVALLLFGLTFSGLLIYWLVYTAQNLSSTSSIISFILNLITILVILGLIFKILTLGAYYKQSPLYKLVVNTILYIPCIFVSIVDNLMSLFGLSTQTLGKGMAAKSTESPYKYITLLLVILLAYIVYFIQPYVSNKFAKQGGKLLINNPVYMNTEQNIGSYQSLNGKEGFDYHYAISFWVYIDSSNTSTNSSYNKYTSILNYGGKPNILYNAADNTLMITMPNAGKVDNASATNTKSGPLLDDSGNIIIYKKSDFLLQKWNNIIVNYNGGTLDIFYNGELVKSVIEVVPYMSYDTLTIGSPHGKNGGICNVNYFNKELNAKQIYYLYNFVKDKTPPIASNSNDTFVDTLAEATHTETSKTDTNAVIDTILVPVEQTTKDVVEQNIEPDLNVYDPSNYLSLRWYFAGNNDNFGVV